MKETHVNRASFTSPALRLRSRSSRSRAPPRPGRRPYVAWEIGIDSLVAFRDFIYQPSDGSDFSGNYYWTRFAAYAQAGYTLRDALNQAAADLFAHDGRYDGYDQWMVGGAAAGPGALNG